VSKVIERVVVIEPMGVGGICHYTYNLCEALSARGVRVSLITARNYELAARPRSFRLSPILNEWFRPDLPEAPPKPSRPPGVLEVVRRRTMSVLMMLRIVGITLRERASVVHLQWPIGLHDTIYLTMLRSLGRRIIYTVHDVLPHEHTEDDVRRLGGLLRHVDRAILHSEENERTFRRIFSDTALPSDLIPLGDFFLFAEQVDLTAAQARASLGICHDARVALFFGGIRPYKGLADLINVFPRVRARVPKAWLIIAGHPFEDFAPYEKAIAAAEIRDCTAMFLKYHAVDEVAKFFRAADVVVLPYRSASQSGVAQLAFAFGTPVIATRVGGLPEIIQEESTGLLVKAGDDTAMADAMIRLLTDEDLRRSMGVRASEVAASHYSWGKIADMTLNVYSLAIDGSQLNLLHSGSAGS
jgi:glycosyltransferase involved in cell wall biosynthesis